MEETNRADEIDLRELFAVLRRHLWLLIAVPLLAALVAGTISMYVLHPLYSASTTLWVIKQESATIDYTTLMTNRNLVTTYAEVARSRAVMEQVIHDLSLQGTTVDGLQSRVSVKPVKDTEIIELVVTDGDPTQAARLANAVASAFMTQLGNFIQLENVAVVDHAVAPTAPIKPRPVLNTAIAGVLGLMAAFGLAFLREYMDTTIKTGDQCERALGLVTLAVVPQVNLEREKLVTAPRKARLKARADDPGLRSDGKLIGGDQSEVAAGQEGEVPMSQ